MRLDKLLDIIDFTPNKSVPSWMIGSFKRRSITYASGQSDLNTLVFWLQSRNLTIDLRLPIMAEQARAKPIGDYSQSELKILANYEGWCANSLWENEQLSWNGGASLQIHNRWPEPALLKRVGDCMIEFAPSGAYVEDWRLLSKKSGPLVGLRLIEEVDVSTNKIRHKGGGLIINGNWAGLVLGRSEELETGNTISKQANQLRDLVKDAGRDQKWLADAFAFETSIGFGNLEKGYQIVHSTQPRRDGEQLMTLDGFEWDPHNKLVVQKFERNGTLLERRFTIDTIEASFDYSDNTPQTKDAADWFRQEHQTIARYLEKLTPAGME